jgi:hypothetical protein
MAAGMALVLVSIALSKPSFSEAGGTITVIGAPRTALAAATGTAAAARLKDGGGNIVISGLTVSTSGADVVLNATAISAGQSVTINSATIQHG